MPSPFPGMDPYLEGPSWPDLHGRVAAALIESLEDSMPSGYAVRQDVRVRDETATPEEVRIFFPDLAVLEHPAVPGEQRESKSGAVATLTAPLRVPAPIAIRHTERTLQVITTTDGQLVTSIEILSPSNKVGEGLADFRAKWLHLRSRAVHLIEIDLIRRGHRIFPDEEIADQEYLVTVTRTGHTQTECWPASLRDRLPKFPIPLLDNADDVIIDLQHQFERIYDRARYGLTLDYSADPPPPALSPEDAAWAREQIAASGALRR